MKGEYCGICELIAGKLEDQIKDKTNEVNCYARKKIYKYFYLSFESDSFLLELLFYFESILKLKYATIKVTFKNLISS